MRPARPVAPGFSPLDDELGLLPGSLTPQAQAALVRLGAEQEFAPAAELLAELTGMVVSESTARRQTYATGNVLLTTQTAAAPALAPPADPGPDTAAHLQLSADGAMIPLVGGAWAEVRTLVIGEVSPRGAEDCSLPHAQQLSYFSRLASATAFTQAAVVETHQRGLRAASAVAAVLDGAPWLQGFVDYHRPDALRILDAPHALDHLHAAAVALWGAGATATTWWQAQKQELLAHGPAAVLADLTWYGGAAQAPDEYAKHQEYLAARREQLNYPAFRAAGWPIGSGIVESANKLVVERRLKGAGMRWAPEHVNPLLTLRNAVCSGRWGGTWSAAAGARRAQVQQRQAAQRARRQAAARPPSEAGIDPTAGAESGPAVAPAPVDVTVVAAVTALLAPTPRPAPQQAPAERRRPAANHPWRRTPMGKACAEPPRPLPYAKL